MRARASISHSKRVVIDTFLFLATTPRFSIVKGVLEAHNATYGVTSSLGNGSTFWFELKTSDSQEYKAEVVDI